MKKACVLAMVVSALLIAGIFSGFSHGEKINVLSERVRGTIRINNDTELASVAQDGNGTKDNPYLISGLYVDAGGSGDAIYIGNTTKYFVIDDSYFFNGSYGVHLRNVTNAIIENNVIMNMNSTTSSNMGIYIDSGCSNIEVSGNKIMMVNGHGVTAYQSDEIYVENNTIANCQQYGVYMYDVQNAKVEFNDVSGGVAGIWLYYSEDVTVANNSVKGNEWYGVVLYSSHYNYVVRNLVEGAGHNGIVLTSLSDNSTTSNTITMNLIFNNTGYGVYAGDYSANNLIYDNDFYFNNGTNGVYNSSNSQGYDKTGQNSWNNATVGNYWYDWANGNAGTTEYRIAGAGVYDHYPLQYGVPMNPQNLTASAGDGYVNLTWKAPYLTGGASVIKYNIYKDGVLIGNVSGTQLWYNDTGLSGGKIYTYYVTAVNPAGEGVRSNSVPAMPTGSIPEFSNVVWLVSILLVAMLAFKRR